MTLQRPTIVLFDMDGTTVRHINPKLLGILEFLDDTSFKIGKFFAGNKSATPYSPDDEPRKSPNLLVHRAIHRMRKKSVEQIVQPCPGIYPLLNILSKQDLPIGIVSNGLGKGYGYDILEKFHLTQFFKTTIFREDFSKSKPHPDPLLRALRDLKDPLDKDDIIWYIGDRHKDILAAIAADEMLDAKVVPIAYGLKAAVAVLEKGLEKGLGPDNIIMNYNDFTISTKKLFKDVGSGPHEKKPKGVESLCPSTPYNDNTPQTSI